MEECDLIVCGSRGYQLQSGCCELGGSQQLGSCSQFCCAKPETSSGGCGISGRGAVQHLVCLEIGVPHRVVVLWLFKGRLCGLMSALVTIANHRAAGLCSPACCLWTCMTRAVAGIPFPQHSLDLRPQGWRHVPSWVCSHESRSALPRQRLGIPSDLHVFS